VGEAGLERACRVPELGVLVKPAEEERVVGERQRQEGRLLRQRAEQRGVARRRDRSDAFGPEDAR